MVSSIISRGNLTLLTSTSQNYCDLSQTSVPPPGVPRCMVVLISYFSLYRAAKFSSIPLLRCQHITPVRCFDLLTYPQDQPSGSSPCKARLQVCVLHPSATASSARGNWWDSVLGMGKARPEINQLRPQNSLSLHSKYDPFIDNIPKVYVIPGLSIAKPQCCLAIITIR